MLHSENSAEIKNKGTISAELTYIVRQKEKPYFESSHSTGGEPKVFFKTEKRNASISDMRPHVSTLSIDSNGFELISHQTHVDDLYNDDLIKAQYNQELEDLLKQHTGADKVVIFDHTRSQIMILEQKTQMAGGGQLLECTPIIQLSPDRKEQRIL